MTLLLACEWKIKRKENIEKKLNFHNNIVVRFFHLNLIFFLYCKEGKTIERIFSISHSGIAVATAASVSHSRKSFFLFEKKKFTQFKIPIINTHIWRYQQLVVAQCVCFKAMATSSSSRNSFLKHCESVWEWRRREKKRNYV